MRPRLFLILNIFGKSDGNNFVAGHESFFLFNCVMFPVIVCWCHQVVYSLSPEDTDGLIRLAREYKRGGVREKSEAKTPPDLEKASQLYKRIIDEGEGPSHVEALFELASINTQSPSDNFILLSKYASLVAVYVTSITMNVEPVCLSNETCSYAVCTTRLKFQGLRTRSCHGAASNVCRSLHGGGGRRPCSQRPRQSSNLGAVLGALRDP